MNWFSKKKVDILAIGDVTTDTFIRLKDASVHCNINDSTCTISMPWGAKIPYEFAKDLSGVGNAANAAVSSARLGLTTAFLSCTGSDLNGDNCISVLKKEHIITDHVTKFEGPSNQDFVLWYETERTILIKHEPGVYVLPKNLEVPRYVYLSSVGDPSGTFHTSLAEWLVKHPEITFAFQPGRELAKGFDPYKALYERANICVVNKQEAEGLLKRGNTPIQELLQGLRALGPKLVFITDGPKGAYSYDGNEMLYLPMYPDPKPPLERTGAGDAFASTLVSALALGKSFKEAFMWGPINSMNVVQYIGAQEGLLSREQLELYLQNAPSEYQLTKLSS